MCKFSLRPDQTMSSMVVDQARGMVRDLVLRESRGPGDVAGAMQRIEARYGVPFSVLWSLRYRPPKRIWADVFLRISAAHEAERERQLRLLEHEIAITKAVAGSSANSVVAAEAVVGSKASAS